MKTAAFVLLVCVLVAGLMYGVARDLYSHERAVLNGTIASITAATGGGHKSTPPSAASFEAALDDGRTVHVITPDVSGLAKDSRVTISEMATPWGQVWYKLKTD